MKLAIVLGALLWLAPAAGAAGSWSGYLVDSKCYEIEEHNVNPWDTSTYVDRDKDLEVRLCSPNARTKSFAVVVPDEWKMLGLDPAGNAKAAEFVRNTAKQREYLVTVAGEMGKNIVKVDSISMTEPPAGELK